MEKFDILIVGGGHAGAQAAIAMRQGKYSGSICIVSAEPELPYERPPLSKEYLAGDKTFDRILIRPASFWHERGVVVRLGCSVAVVEPADHRVITEDGITLGYNQLIWATGGAPRQLGCPGRDLAGSHSVRTRADVDKMMAELSTVEQVVVIGGGYIGLEAAAVLTKLGKKVVLLEALDRVLARVAGEALSRFYEAEHRRHGVDIRLGATVECLVGDAGKVTAVRLKSGEEFAAQMVIVGIGIIPAVEPLLRAGAEGGNGVRVDTLCRTTLPDIHAIGDCALHENRFAAGGLVRLESVQNANDQANVVAKAILGEPAAYDAVPWFWSNQYDLKLQTAGLSVGHDATVMRGDPAARSFSLLYFRERQLIAIDAVNSVKDYVQGRKLVAEGAEFDLARAADTAIPLKDQVIGSSE